MTTITSATGPASAWAGASRNRLAVLGAVVCVVFFTSSAWAQLAQEEVTDEQIANAITAQLFRADDVNANTINVSVENGAVTLTGTVTDLMAEQRAVDIASNTRGVLQVTNAIEVKPPERSDDAIRSDVEWSLENSNTTVVLNVGVSVKDGVVTLTGQVPSWPDRQFAVDVARGVEGVKSVKDDLTLASGGQETDQDIQKEIVARLQNDSRLRGADIKVAVNDGAVTLSGQVASVAHKVLVNSLAWVSGVVSVDDDGVHVGATKPAAAQETVPVTTQTQVQPSPPTDGDLVAAADRALNYTPGVTPSHITVVVKNGAATLTGTVGSLYAKNAAAKAVQNVRGIVSVQNLLRIQTGVSLTDEQLADSVRRALRASAGINQDMVTVSAYNGRVYLTGTVDSRYERQEAYRLAASQQGVVSVVNRLSITPQQYRSDQQIADEVNNELYWNPTLNNAGIQVSVNDGTVTLTGTVDSYDDVQTAVSDAYAAGARQVIEKLKVK